MHGLRDRVYLVTGGATGIGRAITERLLAEGAAVGVGNLGAAGLAAPPGARLAELDVRDRASVERFVANAADHFGRLDGVVNSAGKIGPLRPLLDHGPELFRDMLEVNLEGPFLVTTAAARIMIAAGAVGSVVNVASLAGLTAEEFAAGYVASKFGLVGLTRAMAMELAEHRIRVNAVAPGAVLTDAAREVMKTHTHLTAKYGRTAPLKPTVSAEQVAAAAAYLLSDDAAAVTGITLPVDGGYLA
jgi:NAD(P)-dependent dehydrogenase (short-subunit alcohol dehydrogenase family)